MTTFVPDSVQEALDAARTARLRRSSKLRIETADGYFRILRLWENGFSVAKEDAPNLRGFVDLYDGPTQLFQCLIIASNDVGDEMRFDFKRMTAVHHTPPSDFAHDTVKPVALLNDFN